MNTYSNSGKRSHDLVNHPFKTDYLSIRMIVFIRYSQIKQNSETHEEDIQRDLRHLWMRHNSSVDVFNESRHIEFYFNANLITCTPKILGSASRYLYFWRGFLWKVTSTNAPASPESLALCAATSETSASGSPEEQRQKKSRISPGSVVANNNL